ncbi:hypothetical protein NBE98_20105 [Clostridium swellfunianum]|nr:hypothetical protein [Clostridium swellfunianum]MCM0650669.1 hypothetical protein [Clostridium swellfunianum]
MEKKREVLNLTKEMLEDLYIIATVYGTTVEEVIRELVGVEYDIEYVA